LTGAADQNGRRLGVAVYGPAVHLEIDLATVPPTVALREPDDFTAFDVVVVEVEHAWVGVEVVRSLAGPARAGDPAWSEVLQAMVAYAEGHGWVREDGAMRAHVEVRR
jgi:hypothetical protein